MIDIPNRLRYLTRSILFICFLLSLFLTACGSERNSNEVDIPSNTQAEKIEKFYEKMENDFRKIVFSAEERRDVINYRHRMISIPGGRVALGRNGKEISASRKNAVRLEVDSFELGSMEVTFDLYDLFCKTTKRPMVGDNGWGRGWHPVINVSWYDAIEFSNWMSLASGLQPCYLILKDQKDEGNLSLSDPFQWDILWFKEADGYRLPTEIEWEYTAKGGSAIGSSLYSGSDLLSEVAWVYENSFRKTQPVATKFPNERRVYDLSGNVFEWCWDWYGDYPIAASLRKYSGVRAGTTRILRGGSWFNTEKQLQTIHRAMGTPSFKSNKVGFRLARNADK